MTAEQLLKPRFEVIADYPKSIFKVGEILNGELIYCDTNGPKYSDYPHLFKKLNWWENRKESEMPKKITSPDFDDVYEIVKWDMDMMFGFTDIKKRQGCDLCLFVPYHGYFPVD
ncbi:hypothetical protein [uncultured Draconibacterium sp.]|uniref:hypothetical protein n=1 Tax=uncultured Draconibacterium sp. TaxID=1573823 RepID=UPI0029C8128D|nr:hypothetical protein [uncultured Draconibacterium sp.]